MSASDADAETAACVLVRVSSNAMSPPELSTWIDSQIAARDQPPTWLLDASLAPSAEDKIHHLRSVEGSAQVGADPLLQLEATYLALERQRITADMLASRALHLSWDHDLPPELAAAIYELEEDASCAHAFDGVVQAERVTVSVAMLGARLSAHSEWRAHLEAICSLVAVSTRA